MLLQMNLIQQLERDEEALDLDLLELNTKLQSLLARRQGLKSRFVLLKKLLND
jgi:hypothetical protein